MINSFKHVCLNHFLTFGKKQKSSRFIVINIILFMRYNPHSVKKLHKSKNLTILVKQIYL